MEEDYILFAVSGIGFYGSGIREEHLKEDIYRPDEYNRYMKQMTRMLDILEEHYKLPVKIANHPRTDLRGYDFGGRQIIEGKTLELTKKCRLFVTAITGAIAYPVYYDKDILFFYNQTIKDKTIAWHSGYVPLMEELDLKGLNLDDEGAMTKPWELVSHITPEVKRRYIEKYHHDKGPDDKIYGEILADVISTV